MNLLFSLNFKVRLATMYGLETRPLTKRREGGELKMVRFSWDKIRNEWTGVEMR